MAHQPKTRQPPPQKRLKQPLQVAVSQKLKSAKRPSCKWLKARNRARRRPK